MKKYKQILVEREGKMRAVPKTHKNTIFGD